MTATPPPGVAGGLGTATPGPGQASLNMFRMTEHRLLWQANLPAFATIRLKAFRMDTLIRTLPSTCSPTTKLPNVRRRGDHEPTHSRLETIRRALACALIVQPGLVAAQGATLTYVARARTRPQASRR